MLDSMQITYHHTPASDGTTNTAAISSQLTLSILVGFVEVNTSSITEAVHRGALIGKEEDNGNQNLHDNNLIL
jgi:hypothetical protein